MRSFAQQPVRPGRTVTVPLLFPAWFLWLQRGAACLLVLQVAIVTGDLLVLTGSPGRFVSSVSLAVGDLVFSLGICALATVIALAVAPAVARELFKTDRRGRFFWLAVTLPLALPAPLVGIGLILFWNRMLDSPLYGSALMPVHAVLARFAPVAVIILFARMRMIDPVLHDAARVFQSSAFSRWSAIDLPLLAPGFVVAACMFFALAVGELGATLIVAPAGHATVTMRIYNYLHFGSSADVAGLCLMMTILTLASGFIAILVFSKKESGGGILHTGASSMEVLHD
jgi:iron(III) transport system permease protein